jgi:hypothetical protein
LGNARAFAEALQRHASAARNYLNRKMAGALCARVKTALIKSQLLYRSSDVSFLGSTLKSSLTKLGHSGRFKGGGMAA